MKTDAQIEQDVLRELKWDPRVEETDVGVEVGSRVVALTGTVSSYAKRMAAQEAAHRVAGVLDVANDIQVNVSENQGRTDMEIARAVRHALESDVVVPDSQIRSTVSHVWVILEGEVGVCHERDAAERAISNLPGVRGVVNRIEVNLPYVKGETIQDEIEQALGATRGSAREAHRDHCQGWNSRAAWPGAVVGRARGGARGGSVHAGRQCGGRRPPLRALGMKRQAGTAR